MPSPRTKKFNRGRNCRPCYEPRLVAAARGRDDGRDLRTRSFALRGCEAHNLVSIVIGVCTSSWLMHTLVQTSLPMTRRTQPTAVIERLNQSYSEPVPCM